jgi:hypothetical protein
MNERDALFAFVTVTRYRQLVALHAKLNHLFSSTATLKHSSPLVAWRVSVAS